jgi:hypothetical protein
MTSLGVRGKTSPAFHSSSTPVEVILQQKNLIKVFRHGRSEKLNHNAPADGDGKLII